MTNNPIERRTINDLSEPKLVQIGHNDLLTRQPVKNQLVSPNFVRSNLSKPNYKR